MEALDIFLILLPVIILMIFPVLMLVIRLRKGKFAYFWLVAALGALLPFPLAFALRFRIPAMIPFGVWQPEMLFPIAPALLLDAVSWPFAFALAALALAVILTDVARAPEADWLAWAGGLGLTALGILAVLSGNFFTLLLGWAAIDLVELILLIHQVHQSQIRERVIIVFTARAAGLFVLIWGGMIAASENPASTLSFDLISPTVSVLLLIAAGLRLGVFPLHLPFFEGLPMRRGLGTLIRLIPVAASLVLLPRTAAFGVPADWQVPLLALTCLAAIYGSVAWINAENALDGRPFWILGAAALAVASAIRGQPAAALAWSIAALFAGGQIFLISARHPRLFWVTALSVLDFSALPFTPTWQGLRLYTAPFTPIAIIFLFAHTLLIAGFIRHAVRAGAPLSGVERWVWVIYPLGLALLPISHFAILYWNWFRPLPGATAYPPVLASWPGLAALALAAIILYWRRRGIQSPDRVVAAFRRALSLSWFYRFLWAVYKGFARLVGLLNLIFEGEGGILWTLLLLALLVSLLVQQGLGS